MSEPLYVVVTNDEDQYSIWPAHLAVPLGWQLRTEAADRRTCLEHIRAHWVDMRPRSLRAGMARTAAAVPAGGPV